MPALSFRNRIASYYIISTALLISIVFVVLYCVVKVIVYSDLERDISIELGDLYKEIKTDSSGFRLTDRNEWKEREHNTLDVDPIFIEFVNREGNYIDKSPNLKTIHLGLKKDSPDSQFYDALIDNNGSPIAIHQIQSPVIYKGRTVGYLLVAMSLEDAHSILHSLSRVMFVSYPLILLLLFAIARIIAGRSIRPVTHVIDTAESISRDNLKARISLPQRRDELYTLSLTINELLDRIESAVEREKQFTSDASHELRNPLAVIRGTLEVLVRKPRSREEYEEKINYCINEVNRLNYLVDQLLLLARFENHKQTVSIESVSLNSLLLDAIARQSGQIQAKDITISAPEKKDYQIQTDSYLFSIIIDNLLSNSVKYSGPNSNITFHARRYDGKLQLQITDSGSGIAEEELKSIYERFYRSKTSENSEIKGTGLGLSIVKRLCTLLDIAIEISSNTGTGTTVILTLNSH